MQVVFGRGFRYSAPIMDFKYRLKRFFLLSAFGLALGGALAGISLTASRHGGGEGAGMAAGIGGPFTLINQDGKTVTDQDFPGRYQLIYFGFASCPAICPTELQKMAEAMKELPPAIKTKVQPIFITVDPKRDTQEILKSYVALFMPELIGLTGNKDQIETAKKAFHVYSTEVREKGAAEDEYNVDHSSFIYLMGPDGKLLAMFKTADKAHDIALRIQELQGRD